MTARLAILFGPLSALSMLLFVDLDPGNPAVTRTAAVALLMAIWWITEAVPLAVTALVPVVLFPLLGVMKPKVVAPLYFNDIIFLFVGAFVVALAMQRWELHRRIGLRILLLVGVGSRRLVLGFMATTAFLSMWISNTATAMMMMPIAMAVIARLEQELDADDVRRFAIGLLLGIAYAASVGGFATLIGTPPNLLFARVLTISFPNAPEISFAAWMAFALPISIVFFGVIWLLVTTMYRPRAGAFKLDAGVFREAHRRLGRISYEERAVLVVFVAMALLWLTRSGIAFGAFRIPGWSALLPESDWVSDSTVAVTAAIALFLIPTRTERGGRLMDWGTAAKLPWDIVILFGGGFALAGGFRDSGLSDWFGEHLRALGPLSPVLIVVAVVTLIIFLTELTSNTATTGMALPILAELARAIEINPLFLMIPGTLAASCAFMLPVATPPNAVVFGTGRLRVADMARTGFLLNLIGVVLITIGMLVLGRLVLGIDLTVFPEWAAG